MTAPMTKSVLTPRQTVMQRVPIARILIDRYHEGDEEALSALCSLAADSWRLLQREIPTFGVRVLVTDWVDDTDCADLINDLAHTGERDVMERYVEVGDHRYWADAEARCHDQINGRLDWIAERVLGLEVRL